MIGRGVTFKICALHAWLKERKYSQKRIDGSEFLVISVVEQTTADVM